MSHLVSITVARISAKASRVLASASPGLNALKLMTGTTLSILKRNSVKQELALQPLSSISTRHHDHRLSLSSKILAVPDNMTTTESLART